MTLQQQFQAIDTVNIYEVELRVKKRQEMIEVENWLRDHGLIKQRTYFEDLDEWGRPHTVRSKYLIVMKKDKKRILKGYVTQKNQYMKSKLSFQPLDSHL